MTAGSPPRRAGVVGVGAAACAACCAPPIIAFLAAAGIGTLIGVALFGILGISALTIALIPTLRHRVRPRRHATSVPVTLTRNNDA